MIFIMSVVLLLSLVMINNYTLFGLLLAMAYVAAAALKYKKYKLNNKNYEYGIYLTGVLISVICIISKTYVFYILQELFVLGVIWYWSILSIGRSEKIGVKISKILGLLIYLIISIYLIAVAVNPMVLVGPLQKSSKAVNSYEAAVVSESKNQENGSNFTNDVEYGTTYPNSFLDIYSHQDENDRPTFFYIHGGGYVWGDKYEGDPNAENAGVGWVFDRYLEEGYNVVSVNYAFAPEYEYPTAVIQLNEALEFLKENGSAYGISMDQVVIAGTSAGGNMAGMLGLICSNEGKAKELGTKQYLTDEVKAVVFMSALINNEDFSITHSAIMDYVFLQCGRTAMNANILQKSDIAKMTNVIEQVNENYPLSYISDGNAGTFYSQAIELDQRLEELGVRHQLNLYSKKAEKLGHGFETDQTSVSARRNLKSTLDFLKSVLN